jgi:hypothetical protein
MEVLPLEDLTRARVDESPSITRPILGTAMAPEVAVEEDIGAVTATAVMTARALQMIEATRRTEGHLLRAGSLLPQVRLDLAGESLRPLRRHIMGTVEALARTKAGTMCQSLRQTAHMASLEVHTEILPHTKARRHRITEDSNDNRIVEEVGARTKLGRDP